MRIMASLVCLTASVVCFGQATQHRPSAVHESGGRKRRRL